MKRKGSVNKLSILFLLGFLWILPVASPAQSPPTLDGFLDNVYLSHGYSVNYDGFYPQANATLYVLDNPGIDSTYVYVAWIISPEFNDNSYGANTHSTWTSGHIFFDLYESDKQRLDLENTCGELVLDVTMDLLDGPGYATPSGFEAAYNAASEDSSRDYISTGDWTDITYDTSLAGNLNDLGYCSGGTCTVYSTDLHTNSPPFADDPTYTPASPYDDWEYRLIWELRIDRTVFQTLTCPGATILGVATNPVELHASPSKIGVSPVTLFKASSAIGDYVWYDLDRDGVQDETERGIPNVTLALYTDPNGDGNPADGSIIATTVTDAYGRYIFSGLGEGNYVVDVTDTNNMLTNFSTTTGTTDPHGTIPLTRNEHYLDADFGYAPSDLTRGVIGDYIWSDYSNDGMQDPGEPGIGGVTVDLLQDIDGDGNFTDLVATATTADDGSYLFEDLLPGEYRVDVTDTAGKLTGYTLTVGAQSSTAPTETIALEAGESYLNADFGYYRAGLGRIGNQIWFDEDADGTFDAGEPGVEDVTINLIKDSNGNGVWDAGERVVSTISTTDGTYQFVGLELDDGDGDADYLVHVTDIHDKLRRYRLVNGPNDGSDNNSQIEYYPVALSAASPNNQTADFGYWFDHMNGLVGDRVWYDLDGDGVQDGGEPGVEGVTVELWTVKNGSDDRLQGYVTTDKNGNYYFPNLDIGQNENKGVVYRVKVVDDYLNDTSSPLYGHTPTNQGLDDQADSDGLRPSVTQDLSLDFGYTFNPGGGSGPTYSIGDYVWHDGNGDGIQDAWEDGFENVTMALYHDKDGDGILDATDPLVATDVTDASGNYLFSGLVDGTYLVKVTDEYNILAGYQRTYGTQPWPVTLSGASNLSIDYGYFRSSPTLAFVSPFQVYNEGGRLVVQWQTVSESGTAGFYLYSKDAASGQFKPVSDFLPGLLNAPQGGIYRFADETAGNGFTHTYMLVEVESRGGKRIHGPYTVQTANGPDVQPWVRLEPMRGLYHKTPRSLSPAQEQRLLARRMEENLYRAKKQDAPRKGSLKAAIQERGIYFIGIEELADKMGASLNKLDAMIKNQRLRLFNQGEDVAWLPAPGNAGIYFYGEKIDSIYTDLNIYWLSEDKGLAMEYVSGGSPAPASEGETFPETIHFEEENYGLTGIFDDPGADIWLWGFLIAGQAGKTYPAYTPSASADGTAVLSVHMKGATDASTGLDHHVKVSLNGTLIGSGQWDGTTAKTITLDFDQSLLEEANTIGLEAVKDSGVPYSIVYLDSFDISYNREYRAENDRLVFSSNGHPVVTVSGFTGTSIQVFDITEPKLPRLVTGTSIDGAGGVSFVPESMDRTYLAVADPGLLVPAALEVDVPSRLKANGTSADHIIIAGPGLESAAQDLAGLRRGSGLNSMVVNLEDIYDEFSYGIVHPPAIKNFISYAYHNWGNKAPRYVVLAGDGSYDYKNILGFGGNLVPPLLKSTPYGLFASDNLLADVDDDGIPEVAIGRLPVLTDRELQTLVDKIRDYESSGGAWTGNALLVADNADDGGDFPADSDYLAGLLAGYNVQKVHLPNYTTVDQARLAIIDAINAGVGLVNYIGHSGLNYMAQEKLLRTIDVEMMQNGDMLPIFTAMTCVVGRYEMPGYETLSETLLLRKDGGAGAVWAPTGSSLNDWARMLAAGFFETLSAGTASTVGQAVLSALQNYAYSGGLPFIVDIYNFLGDPAMEIK